MESSGRVTTTAGVLAKHGFSNTTVALGQIETLAAAHPDAPALKSVPVWLHQAAAAAVPDLAVMGLTAMDEAAPDVVAAVLADRHWSERLLKVLGGSLALNQHLRANPHDAEVLQAEPTKSEVPAIRDRCRAALGLHSGDWQANEVADALEAADRLRAANRRELVRIVARDLCAPDPTLIVHEISAELADLADQVMAGALCIARAEVPDHAHARLGIVALGKTGGQELNYLSDVDVLYVGEPADDQTSTDEAIAITTKLAAAVSRICSAHSQAGTIWAIDAALRPEGNAGPLVRTLASHRAYYDKWAQNWEFQAMLKARPMAGDLGLAQDFVEMVSKYVWTVGGQQNFLTETRAMRKRVITNIPAKSRDREIKLGAGGLRDVEFSVQLLQLVHGRADDRLRQRGTLPALAALVEHGYIGRADGAAMDEAYRFARCLEHREQFFRLRRTHLMPNDSEELRRLARQFGQTSGQKLWDQWRESTRKIQGLQQRIFYSPLLARVSTLDGEALSLSKEAAHDRLHALGYADPESAMRHIDALTTGVNRAAEIQRQLMPAMLEWFSEGPNPDLGLLGFRKLSESMGSASWYLRALRDENWMAERLAKILSSSRYLFDLLRRDPSVVQFLADDELLVPRTRAELNESMAAIIDRHDNADAATEAVRATRRRELFRLGVGDVLGVTDLAALGQGLSDLASAAVQAALDIALAESDLDGVRIGVVAMGRWGGAEMSYASDADAMVIVDDDATPEQISQATAVVARMRALLRAPGPDPAIELDMDLRPEGRNGAMVRTLSSYLTYYEKWSDTWEAQALLRAGYGAGDEALVQEFLNGIDYLRYPADGLNTDQVRQIRRLKARMESERGGRTLDRNLKLGPGGLSDVEWTAQLLQLEHGHEVPGLRTTGTLRALAAAHRAELITADDLHELSRAWELASELRNKAMLVRGKASDLLPSDPRDTAAVAMLLGMPRGEASVMLESQRKQARHASNIVDRLFWGKQ